MKLSFVLFYTAILFSISCKKSGSGPGPELWLNKVITNGHLSGEYIYANDKRLIRYNEYIYTGGQNKLLRYTLYEYGPEGNITERKVFASNNTLDYRYDHLYDNNGRLSRVDRYSGATLYEYDVYAYDGDNRINKITTKNGTTNQTKDYFDYTYDEQGRLLTVKGYLSVSGVFKLIAERQFNHAGQHVYQHMEKFQTNPGDLLLPDLTMDSRHYVTFDIYGNVTTDYSVTASEKQYNASGYLVSQTATQTNTKPELPDVIRYQEYVYTP